MKTGTLVAVLRDNGDVLITKTRSKTTKISGRKVVQVEGISGVCSLDTVRPILKRNINPFCLIAFEEAMAEASTGR